MEALKSGKTWVKHNAGNYFSLVCIQLSNALLPLFVFPFTLKVVGKELYSTIAVTEAVALIGVTFVLYSYEVNGVSRIVDLNLKRDLNKISHIFSTIFFSRVCMFLVCVVLVLLASPFLDRNFLILLSIWLLIPVSHIFQSSYLFQGLERNAPLAVCTLLSRIICVVLIFYTIETSEDYYLVPTIVGCCYVVGGVLAFFYALTKFKIRLQRVSFLELKQFLFNGKNIFLGNLSVTFFRDFNIIILSYFSSDPLAIATYSISEKLIKSFQATMRPLNKLFFPKVISAIKDLNKPTRSAFIVISRSTLPQLCLLFMGSLIIGILYVTFVDKLSFLNQYPGKEHIELLVTVMLISAFFGVGNFMYGTAGLNYLNSSKYYARSIFSVAVMSVLICSFLVVFLNDLGAAISFVSSEVLLFFSIVRRYFRE